MLYYIGAGSNLGDRLGYIRKAIVLLKETPGMTVGKVSPVYETPAEGGPAGQADYLNLALELTTDLGPEALLEILKDVERKTGRPKRAVRWDEREIDLDILLCGTGQFKTETLTVPHPMMEKRFFVLRPLADLAPEEVVPGTGKSVAALLAGLENAPPERRYEKTH